MFFYQEIDNESSGAQAETTAPKRRPGLCFLTFLGPRGHVSPRVGACTIMVKDKQRGSSRLLMGQATRNIHVIIFMAI